MSTPNRTEYLETINNELNLYFPDDIVKYIINPYLHGPFHLVEIHQTYDLLSDLDYRTYVTTRTIRILSTEEDLREYMVSYMKHYYSNSKRNIEKLINSLETNSIEKIISFWIRRGYSNL